MSGSVSLRRKMITWLRTIADQLENGDLVQKEERVISEFYMKFKFISDSLGITNGTTKDYDDFMRYLSLGWYLYNNLPIEEQEI